MTEPKMSDYVHSTRQIANLAFRWPDVPMPLAYQVPMPIIDELLELGLVALEGDQKDTYTWAGKGTQLGAIKDKYFKDKEARMIVRPDVMAERVITKIEVTERGVSIEVVNGPTSEHPKPLEG